MPEFFKGDKVRINVGPRAGRIGTVGRVVDPSEVTDYNDSEYPRVWYDDDELELIERADAWDADE